MPDQLKPLLFIVRDNGSIVPLIAADELPHHIRLEGVPRNMNMGDTVGMTSIGTYPSRHQQYKIININDNAKLPSQPPPDSLPSLSADIYHRLEDDTTGRKEYIPVDPTNIDKAFRRPRKAYGIQEQEPEPEMEEIQKSTTAASNTDLAVIRRDSKPVAKYQSEVLQKPEALPAWKDKTALGMRLPPPGKKEYCTHWMSTGECDFAQQGCMYKHMMPLDIEMLNHLGYQDIPRWYRERYGIGPLAAVPGSGAHAAGRQNKPIEDVQSAWKPGQNARNVSAFNKRCIGNRFPRSQITNSPFRPVTKPNTNTDTNSSQHPAKYQRHPDANIRTTFKSTARHTGASLLDSRYAPMQPVNANPTPPPIDRLSLGSTEVRTTSDSSDASSLSPSNESNTNTVQTVVGSPAPSARATFIPQANPNRSTKSRRTQPPDHRRHRRRSVVSQVSAFSDYEAEIFNVDQARRALEDERYARLCAQAEEVKKNTSQK